MPRLVSVLLAVLGCGLFSLPLLPQISIPIAPAPAIGMPAIDHDGNIILLGSAFYPDGNSAASTDLWLWSTSGQTAGLTNLTSLGSAASITAITSYALSADGSEVAYILSGSGGITGQIHTISVASGADSLLTTNTEGCPQPLVICAGCYFPCVHDVHLAADGRVLYLVSGSPLFNLVDPSGNVTSLPVYTGSVALGPRRVISDTGVLVFVSSQTSSQNQTGANDIYTINLDGTGLRNVTQFSNVNDFAQQAVISADGQTIAFESNYGIENQAATQVFVINGNGSGLHQLTSGNTASNASLSGDGSLVAFVQSGQVQVAPSSGSAGATSLTSFQYSNAQDAVMGDDQTEVAFAIGPGGSIGAIYRAPASGGNSSSVYAPTALNGGITDVTGFDQPSPGSLVSIYGLNFSVDQLLVANTFPLPPALGGISILLNGQPIPIEAVSPWQVNAQLPQTAPTGNVTLQVAYNGFQLNSVTAQILASAPAAFASPVSNAQNGGYWQVAAFHAGTTVLADANHPAAPGETLETYGCGLGVTTPQVAAGQPSPSGPPASAVVTPTVEIGLQPAQVTFAGLVPGLAGIYQVNVVVPQGLSAGMQTFSWTAENSGAAIFVQ
ncbi:MAG: hypothetical protein ABSH50_30595 [Bryobacteraceae bacterium]|jgi:uncharacterized protein (TIGR03437 family)